MQLVQPAGEHGSCLGAVLERLSAEGHLVGLDRHLYMGGRGGFGSGNGIFTEYVTYYFTSFVSKHILRRYISLDIRNRKIYRIIDRTCRKTVSIVS